MKLGSLCCVVLLAWGCGSESKRDETGVTPTQSPISSSAHVRQRSSADVAMATPQRVLDADQVRVALLVLPGDAAVEVDKIPVFRRNGMVELVGRVGDEFRVDISWWGDKKIERMVKIEPTGASPASIDAEEESKAKSGPVKGPAIFNDEE